MRHVLKDAYAVFANTNYWASRSREVELQQGVNIADAAKVRKRDNYLSGQGQRKLNKLTGNRRSAFDMEQSPARN